MPDKKLEQNHFITFTGIMGIIFFLSACVPVYRMTGIPLKARCLGKGVTSVSASRSSDSYVLSYCDKKKSLIAIGDYETGNIKIVLKSNDALLERPLFLNKDGDIAFIHRKTVDKSSVKIIRRDGSVTQLTENKPESNNITDMVLSQDGETLYYVNSQSYGRSSPVGPYSTHENDFYSLNLLDNSIQRLSFSNEYRLPGLSVSGDGKTIFSRSDVLEPGENKIKRIDFNVEENLPFTSDHLTWTSQFPLSPVSTQNQFILSCGKAELKTKSPLDDYPQVKGYGLFNIKLPERIVTSEIIYLKSHLNSPAYLEKREVVLFTREPFEPIFRKPKRELWSVKFDGSDLRRIPLQDIE